jgi:hypothetical protein
VSVVFGSPLNLDKFLLSLRKGIPQFLVLNKEVHLMDLEAVDYSGFRHESRRRMSQNLEGTF